MNLTRRATLIGAPLALTGCATSGTTSATTAETDLLLIDNAAIQIANTLAPTNPTLAAGLTNGADKPLDLAKAGLTALLNGTVPPMGASTPAQIVGILSADLGSLAPVVAVALPGSTPYVLAAQVLLATAGTLLGSPVPAPAQPVMAALKPGAVAHPVPTPDEARATLKMFMGTR